MITIVLLLSLFGWAQGSAATETNRWNGMTSSTFTQAFVRVDAPAPYNTFADIDLGWELQAFAGHFPLPPNDLMVGVLLELQGQRISPALFVVDVSIHEGGWPLVGTTQVAVVRFSGDPIVFEGVEATGVEDIVDLGLIDDTDILAVANHSAINDLDFQMDVDVTGMADEDILIFAAVAGPIPGAGDVPAVSTIGLLVLILALFGFGAWALWRIAPTRRASGV